MIRYFLVLCTLLSAFGCQRDKDARPKEYEVITHGVGGDCHKPLMTFVDPSQQEEVEQLFVDQSGYGGYYYGINLPATLPAGTSVYVTLRRPKDSELPLCTAMGPVYKVTVVTSYRLK